MNTIPVFPKPPRIPTNLLNDYIEEEIPTKRYWEIPTIPSPPPNEDIDYFDYVNK